MPGYSGTPLAQKLGIKPGARVRVHGVPVSYSTMLAPLPEDVLISSTIRSRIDLWHVFTTSLAELTSLLPIAMKQIHRDGMIWVSWPKRTSRVPTDITEDRIRDVALPLGLVDIKVCAVDDIWSGLKLVLRKELR